MPEVIAIEPICFGDPSYTLTSSAIEEISDLAENLVSFAVLGETTVTLVSM
jgi:hypothetical protein